MDDSAASELNLGIHSTTVVTTISADGKGNIHFVFVFLLKISARLVTLSCCIDGSTAASATFSEPNTSRASDSPVHSYVDEVSSFHKLSKIIYSIHLTQSSNPSKKQKNQFQIFSL